MKEKLRIDRLLSLESLAPSNCTFAKHVIGSCCYTTHKNVNWGRKPKKVFLLNVASFDVVHLYFRGRGKISSVYWKNNRKV